MPRWKGVLTKRLRSQLLSYCCGYWLIHLVNLQFLYFSCDVNSSQLIITLCSPIVHTGKYVQYIARQLCGHILSIAATYYAKMQYLDVIVYFIILLVPRSNSEFHFNCWIESCSKCVRIPRYQCMQFN